MGKRSIPELITKHPGRAFLAFTALALAAMAGWWALRFRGAGVAAITDHGAFGDAFAPVIGLFSSLALGGAVLSVFIQREELQLQREEMQAMREEATEQRKAAQQLAEATRLANELARAQIAAAEHANRLAEARNALEHDRAEREERQYVNALRTLVATASQEVQRWDEIGVRASDVTNWLVWRSGKKKPQGYGDLGWVVDARKMAQSQLDGFRARLSIVEKANYFKATRHRRTENETELREPDPADGAPSDSDW